MDTASFKSGIAARSSPNEANRANVATGGVLCRALFVVGLLMSGCGAPEESPRVEEARRHLQLGRPQQAIDRLAGLETSEACYLRALALERSKLPDAARDQIQIARDKSPGSLKYQGFALRLALHDGNEKTANELIELYRQHQSSPHVALFAFYAFQSKSIVHSARREQAAVLQNRDEGVEALKNALARYQELPEFQLELLAFAITFAQGPAAEQIVERLDPLLGSDRALAQQRIIAKLLVGKTGDAIQAASDFYRSENRSETSATLLATALSRGAATPARDQMFADVVDRFPANRELLTKRAVYLARSNRLTEAVLELNESIKRQRDATSRQMLQYVAVDLPLEAGSPDVAEAQLNLYRDDLGQEMLIRYFEGRISALRGEHQRALELLASVVEISQQQTGRGQALAAEAARWMQLIHTDQLRTQQWQRLSDYVQGKSPLSQQLIQE